MYLLMTPINYIQPVAPFRNKSKKCLGEPWWFLSKIFEGKFGAQNMCHCIWSLFTKCAWTIWCVQNETKTLVLLSLRWAKMFCVHYFNYSKYTADGLGNTVFVLTCVDKGLLKGKATSNSICNPFYYHNVMHLNKIFNKKLQSFTMWPGMCIRKKVWI